ncbi:MAG: hypothetical protein BGO21_00735 [Dyadobacter sp. 50-39]|nr:MAG: hypothetical protein BGO21_00735 [Dyadobacter sp. 50-39]
MLEFSLLACPRVKIGDIILPKKKKILEYPIRSISFANKLFFIKFIKMSAKKVPLNICQIVALMIALLGSRELHFIQINTLASV